MPSLRHTNQVIGVYANDGTRIHVYRYLDRMRENAIYCDTASVIYIQPRDEPKLIETGNKLGEMTSKMRQLETISEFVSGGPNNYAYSVLITVTGDGRKKVCKVRGITLNYNASRLVNFEVISNMILRGTGMNLPP